MRLWQDARGAILTDGQVLSYIAALGDLEKASKAGNIRFLADTDAGNKKAQRSSQLPGRTKKLSDYLGGSA